MSPTVYIGFKLLPFFATVVLYFVKFFPSNEASVQAAVIKCLPILSLNLFVFLSGFESKRHSINRKAIFNGLLLSCLGDLFLVWPQFFIPGMIAFGIGHLFYIQAMEFKPLNLRIGIILYTIATIMNFILSPGLEGVLVYGVPIYSYLLATMAWRTLARITVPKTGVIEWFKIFIGVAGISWMMSDAFLGFNQFHSEIPYSQVLIMVTYYFGQFGMALSILDAK